MSAPGGRGFAPVAVAAAWAALVAGLGGLLTDIGPWYRSLAKPSWQPPDWLFGPAWTLIFALAAVAGIRAWRASRNPADRRRIVTLFALNSVLNVAWSALFFARHRPDWALVEVALLWASIVALIVGLRSISSTAAWLLAPYLLWVTFASWLNLTIVRLNAPFA
jgi:tryptophan-rich sensory protein